MRDELEPIQSLEPDCSLLVSALAIQRRIVQQRKKAPDPAKSGRSESTKRAGEVITPGRLRNSNANSLRRIIT
jgi:hypothetical protein